MNFKRKPQAVLAYNPEVFDVASLEKEIGEAMHQSIQQNAAAPPLPTIEDIGKVTGEAVMAQYQAAADTINEMKKPMQEWVDQCERALADLKAAMTYIDETAKKFREMGQETHDKIQQSSAAISSVRETCDLIRNKIGPTSQ
jgi:conjugal transfer/entry exclusion protein